MSLLGSETSINPKYRFSALDRYNLIMRAFQTQKLIRYQYISGSNLGGWFEQYNPKQYLRENFLYVSLRISLNTTVVLGTTIILGTKVALSSIKYNHSSWYEILTSRNLT